jgi:Cyclic nucleotide-binding domain/Pyridine nucleotide-disulphide oxidoreductase
MALVTQLGGRRQVREGEYLYREGDVAYDFFVLVSAEVDIMVAVDGGERVIVHHGPGRFLGELNMLTGLRVFVSAKVVTAGEVVEVSRDHLRQLMATRPRLGDTILAAFVARRGLLRTGAARAIRVIGSQFSPESPHIREFLTRSLVPHEWLVVGGGNSAGQAAIFLSQGGCAVTLVIRGSDLGKDMSRYLVERIEANPHITLRVPHDRRRSGRGRDPASRASQRPRRQDRPLMRRPLLLRRR